MEGKIAPDVARQLAHDLRSPLAALDALSGEIARLSESKRMIVHGAIGRIRDIADGLLPRQAPAFAPLQWVSRLELSPGQAVVVLDDDSCIRHLWRDRFESLRAKENGVEVFCFAEPRDLRGWVQEDAARARSAVFLLDHDLSGHEETGLSLAAELGLGERAILVSSRFEEPAIREGCLRLKVRLIAKGSAGMVPISIAGR